MAETKFEKEQYEKREITLTVEATEYFGDKQPLFMRSIRGEATTDSGREIEIAINELGFGIIVRVDKQTFVVSEHGLADAVLAYIDKEDDG
jgi:hypothetical protein